MTVSLFPIDGDLPTLVGASTATGVANGATSLRPRRAAASGPRQDSKCTRDDRALGNRRALTSAGVMRLPTRPPTSIAYRTTQPSPGTYAAFPPSQRSTRDL